MVKSDQTQTGIPVAFLLTRVSNSAVVGEWLLSLKKHLLRHYQRDYSPKVVVMDMGNVEFNAVSLAFPDAFIFYCVFHVLQAWNRKYSDENLGLLGADADTKKTARKAVSFQSAS